MVQYRGASAVCVWGASRVPLFYLTLDLERAGAAVTLRCKKRPMKQNERDVRSEVNLCTCHCAPL